MKVSKIILILLILKAVHICYSKTADRLIVPASRAIAKIIDYFSDYHKMSFHLLTLRQDKKFKNFKALAEKVSQFTNFPIYTEEIKNLTEAWKYYYVGVSYVLLISHEMSGLMTEFVLSLPELSIKRTVGSFSYSIILQYAESDEPSQLNVKYDRCMQGSIDHKEYELVISNDYTSFKLFNCILYQEHSCIPEWKSINFFNISSTKWTSNNFIVKYRHFENCYVNLGVDTAYFKPYNQVLFVNRKNMSDGERVTFGGVEGDFINLFSEMKRISYPRNEHFHDNYFDYNFEYGIRPFGLWLHNFNKNRPLFVHQLTSPIMIFPFTFVVTRGLPIGPVEKLYLPFDGATWICLIVSGLVGLSTIIIIKMFPIKVQRFVFGRKIRYPIFNMFQIFFGIGLIKVPGRNFARFLFASFVLFCLVIRNAYQGKLFEFITGNARHSTAKTIQDLIDMKIPLLSLEHYLESYM